MSKPDSVGAASMQPIVHTPGPWRPGRVDKSYDPGIPDNAFAVFAERQHQQDCGLKGNAAVICVVAIPERMTEEDIANAKLIAAAPDMIEVLKEVALPPWPDSDLTSLLETLRVRAKAVLQRAV